MELEKLPPLTIEDISSYIPSVGSIDKKTLQLQVDALNVLENRVDISTFPPEYQKQIDNYYRFSPVSSMGSAGRVAMMSAARGGKG